MNKGNVKFQLKDPQFGIFIMCRKNKKILQSFNHGTSVSAGSPGQHPRPHSRDLGCPLRPIGCHLG